MATEINEKLVRISAGVVPIETDLTLGEDVTITIEGNVTKEETCDNQDGTVDVIYVIKGIIAYVNEEPIEG